MYLKLSETFWFICYYPGEILSRPNKNLAYPLQLQGFFYCSFTFFIPRQVRGPDKFQTFLVFVLSFLKAQNRNFNMIGLSVFN